MRTLAKILLFPVLIVVFLLKLILTLAVGIGGRIIAGIAGILMMIGIALLSFHAAPSSMLWQVFAVCLAAFLLPFIGHFLVALIGSLHDAIADFITAN